ncbi:MAG TPA: aminoacyl-tRNA hydrolase, partial [Verrucomicrobiae bacterium]|nr:aminoacyl-tRNA hydrolase [Verrucomicrobiae bacterium]
MKIIAGLGNPGPTYHGTRHNAGFMVLEQLSRLAGCSIDRKKFSALYGEGSWCGERVVLLQPQTYMNLSGRSVAEALRFYKLGITDLIVVHDELDLPFGQIRLKQGGGHGGHNGLRSIIADTGSAEFLRLRFGIGRPPRGTTEKYVLSPFGKEEAGFVPHVVEGACEALEMLLK